MNHSKKHSKNQVKYTRRDIIKKSGIVLTTMAIPYPLSAFMKYKNISEKNNFEVIIIGGSYSGLSTAMALGRALRDVLIIDSGMPCNNQTPYSHNFITHDGEKPNVIAEKAKSQVLKYETIRFINDLAVDGKKTNNGFTITTQTGKVFTTQKIVFATGVKDIMPNIKGFSECWGKSILHCPYCHGYEVRGEKTGILADGNFAFHYAQLILNWTKDLTIFTNGPSVLTNEQKTKITNRNIPIIEKEIALIKHENGSVSNILFKDETYSAIQAIYSRPIFEQHCKIAGKFGCEITEEGYIKVDMFQSTTIENIYACGDCTSPMRSIANAVSSGNITGAVINNTMTSLKF